jgi:PTH1 family peptidyl-tRNA hydrolase
LGTQDFARLRIGIGKPPRKEQVTDYVLKRPTGTRRQELAEHVVAAADALETLLDFDFEEAQRRVNGG